MGTATPTTTAMATATAATATAATTATAKATTTTYDGDGSDDADGDVDKTKSARSVLCRQRLVRHVLVLHGCKFNEKAFPCLIQTGEGFSLNLHLAEVNGPDTPSRPRGAAW